MQDCFGQKQDCFCANMFIQSSECVDSESKSVKQLL